MIAFELVDLFRKLNGNRPGFSQICEASKKLIIVLFSIMGFLLLMHSSPKKRDVEVVGYWECENSKSDVNKNKQKKTTEKKRLEERNGNILFIYISAAMKLWWPWRGLKVSSVLFSHLGSKSEKIILLLTHFLAAFFKVFLLKAILSVQEQDWQCSCLNSSSDQIFQEKEEESRTEWWER